MLVIWDGSMLTYVEHLEGAYSLSIKFSNCEDQVEWVQSNIYGPTAYSEKEDLWGELEAIGGWWSLPWCMCGNFNTSPSTQDRQSRRID